MWKCQHDGREVAAKALRVYQTSDFERIRRVGYPQLVYINELTVPRTEVLQGGCDVEGPLSSERVAVIRRDDDRYSIRDGIGVDGKREHQSICENKHRRRSVGACMFLVQDPYFHLTFMITW